MRKIVLVCAGIFTMIQLSGQIQGGFYQQMDYFGNIYVYFQGTNNTRYHYNIDIQAVNELTGEMKSWSINPLRAGNHFTVGIEDEWLWLPGEKLFITYENGDRYFWTYAPNYNAAPNYNSLPDYNSIPNYNNNPAPPITCNSCFGKGNCKWCGGSGRYEYSRNGICGTCNGNGRCPGCNGKGHY